MDQIYYTYETALGNVVIVSDGSAVIALYLEDAKSFSGKKTANKLTDQAARQLEEYFCGKRRQFDLPLRPLGTGFQQAAWKGLLSIPYGETRSYKQVAQMIGNPNASRAVGMANNKNPIWIMIPCHRVVGSNGGLVGYAGGLEMKKKLLELEKTFKPK
jgi:methylated-DNA-[protein]-cysteine S-methyltransferase